MAFDPASLGLMALGSALGGGKTQVSQSVQQTNETNQVTNFNPAFTIATNISSPGSVTSPPQSVEAPVTASPVQSPVLTTTTAQTQQDPSLPSLTLPSFGGSNGPGSTIPQAQTPVQASIFSGGMIWILAAGGVALFYIIGHKQKKG